MSEVRHIGACNIDDESLELFLINGEEFVYVSKDEVEDFLASLGTDKDYFEKFTFKDKNLEFAIKDSLGKNYGGLTIADLKKVESLDVSTMDIRDFTGLEKLENLKVFKAWMVPTIRKFTHLIKDLKKLEFIDLGSCDLTYLKHDTFLGLTRLKEVALDSNLMYELPKSIFSTNKNLKWLHVDGTGVADLEFLEGLSKLESLYAEDNRINNLSGLRFCHKLSVLRLSNNKIRTIRGLSHLKDLKTLHVDDNQLEDIDAVENLDKLEQLRAQNNNIRDIHCLKNLDRLEVLYLDNNDIQDISPLRYKKNLSQLQIRNNRLKTVEPLNKLTNLRVLNLVGNSIIDYSHLDNIYGDLTNKDF